MLGSENDLCRVIVGLNKDIWLPETFFASSFLLALELAVSLVALR